MRPQQRATSPPVSPVRQRVELGGGWVGYLLTGADIASPSLDNCDVLPTAELWTPWLKQLVDDPQLLPGRTVLKYSERGEVFRAMGPAYGVSGHDDPPDGPLEVICKTSRPLGPMRRLVGRWRGSRERRNWKRALILLHAGIPTPRPLALLEHAAGAPSHPSWIITAALADVVDLHHVAFALLQRLEPTRARSIAHALGQQISEMLAAMDKNRLWHRDFKASNILVTDWEGKSGGPGIWLADLDGVLRRSRLARHGSWRPIMRLAASLSDCPALTRGDHLRFLQDYLRRSGIAGFAWKNSWRRLARHAARYNRLAVRRKHDKLDGFAGRARSSPSV